MGKGDRKTAKGKRYNSSYGNARKHVSVADATPVTGKSVSKAAAKKSVIKKTVAKAG